MDSPKESQTRITTVCSAPIKKKKKKINESFKKSVLSVLDSGSHDEGIDIHRKKEAFVQLAKSLPVNVPVCTNVSADLERDDVSIVSNY